MLFKSSPAVLELLRAWGPAYHSAGFKKDQVTLRELLWLSDLRIHILPPEYNVRYEKYMRVWEEKEAIPRILHFSAFHESFPAPRSKLEPSQNMEDKSVAFCAKWLRRIVPL